MVTVTINDNISDVDFLPLKVIFQEKLYSVGKIPGGFLKREGKPSEYSILSARIIDRVLRPLFLKNFRNEIQIIINVLAVDNNNDIRIVSLFAASLAISISNIPFSGPIAGIIVAIDKKNNIVINPTSEQINNSKMELIIAGKNNTINMVELKAKEIPESLILKAILSSNNIINQLIDFQNEIVSKIGIPKIKFKLFNIQPKIISYINKYYNNKIIKSIKIKEKIKRYKTINNLTEQAINNYFVKLKKNTEKKQKQLTIELKTALNNIIRKEIRRQILIDKIRLDGRQLNQIRPLNSKIDILPVVHGSALFTRGETQVLSIVTLGSLKENQIINGIANEENKRFIHHYNFPPFSVGETGWIGHPSRREIGHGALGEKALLQIIPDEKIFPYTIRIVSEVLESNGSTSQASICSATLALMAAGVPITSPVVGISMGLIKEKNNYAILTDIQGMEDNFGDMDFKIAGTKKGICALQMDIKISGINKKIFKETLKKSKKAQSIILNNILKTIPNPRKNLSTTAPKMKKFMIPIKKIREIIGPGGKMIENIIEKSNYVKIDIENNGKVIIYHKEETSIEKAYKLIKEIALSNNIPVSVGEEIKGTVVKIEKFGVFINLKKNIHGLIHISKLSKQYIKKIEDFIKLNDIVKVKVIEINKKLKIKLQLIEILSKNNL